MMLFILIISVVGFAFCNVFAKNFLQKVLAVVLGIVFLASLTLITLNVTNHFGMETVTTVKSQALVSSATSKDFNVLLYQPLGNGKEKVYLYRTNEEQKKPIVSKTDKTSFTIKQSNNNDAKVIIKKYEWVYKNDFYKLLFGIADNNHEYIKQHYRFEIPNSWPVLSVNQAKAFAKLMKENNDKIKADAQTFIKEQVMKAMKQNPMLDEASKQKLIEQAQKQYQVKVMQQYLQQVKKEVK